MTDYRPENMVSCCSALSANLAMMRDLGRGSHTYGHWKHKFGAGALNIYADFIINPLAIKGLTSIRERK